MGKKSVEPQKEHENCVCLLPHDAALVNHGEGSKAYYSSSNFSGLSPNFLALKKE